MPRRSPQLQNETGNSVAIGSSGASRRNDSANERSRDFEQEMQDLLDRSSRAIARTRTLIAESKFIVQSIQEARGARGIPRPAEEPDKDEGSDPRD